MKWEYNHNGTRKSESVWIWRDYRLIRLLYLLFMKMTVKELIEKLKQFDEDKEICIQIMTQNYWVELKEILGVRELKYIAQIEIDETIDFNK